MDNVVPIELHFASHEWFTAEMHFIDNFRSERSGKFIQMCSIGICKARTFYSSTVSARGREQQFRCKHKFVLAKTNNAFHQERAKCVECGISYYFDYQDLHIKGYLFDVSKYEI